MKNKNSMLFLLLIPLLAMGKRSTGSANGDKVDKNVKPKVLPNGTITYECHKGCKIRKPFSSSCWVRDYDYKVKIQGWKLDQGKLVPFQVISGNYDYSNLRTGGRDKGLSDATAKYEAQRGVECNWEVIQTACFKEDAKKDGQLDALAEFFNLGDLNLGDLGLDLPDGLNGLQGGGAVGR